MLQEGLQENLWRMTRITWCALNLKCGLFLHEFVAMRSCSKHSQTLKLVVILTWQHEAKINYEELVASSHTSLLTSCTLGVIPMSI